VGVAEEGETDDVGEAGEGVGQGVGVKEHLGSLTSADVAGLGEGGVGVDAGWNVHHEPDVLVLRAGGGELGAEPGDLGRLRIAGRLAVAGGVAS